MFSSIINAAARSLMKISKSLLHRSHYRVYYFLLLRSRQQLWDSLAVPRATNQNLVPYSVNRSTHKPRIPPNMLVCFCDGASTNRAQEENYEWTSIKSLMLSTLILYIYAFLLLLTEK